MDKEEFMFYNCCRIILARELNIPPDNIDVLPIVECAKRAIIENCKSDNYDGPILVSNSTEEHDAIFGNHGPFIVNKLFSGESPFFDWAQKYEEKYLRSFLEKLNGRIERS